MTTPELLSGRYRLGRILGRGGMGVVYQAHDEILGRDVAVKMLHVDQASPESIERFRREARILAGLSNPNIVTVYDFAVEGDRAWLVMRMLPGPTLQTLLKKRGRLPVDAAERYTREAASALAAAHAAGIVHRDIKPGNLMLGDDGSCTLVDLGIARLAGATEAETGLTQPGMMLGTVHYLAPEVITGDVPTPASDIYALGGVLFLMLTGRTPFTGSDTVSALGQHVHAPIPSLRQLRPDIPPGLERLCQRMLAKNPAERPSAEQVVAALGGPGVRPAPQRPPVPPVIPPGAATAATRAMNPGPPPRLPVRPPTTPPPAPPEDDGGSSRGWVIAACVAVAVIVAALLWLLLAGNHKSPSTPGTTAPASPPAGQSSSTPQPSRTTPSPSPSTSSRVPQPTESVPSMTIPSQSAPSTDPSTQQTLRQEVQDIHSALGTAVENGNLSAAQTARLNRDYNQLDQAVQSGNTDAAGSRLSTLNQTVDNLYGSGAITEKDYNKVSEATATMRGTLTDA